jgi:hypothetical protein
MVAARRLVPLTGLGGIALLVAGLASDRAPTSSWPDARIRGWYHDHGSGPWLTSAYLVAAAAPLLLAFTAELRSRAALAGAGTRAQSLLMSAGIAFAVTVLTGAALYAAVPAARVFNKAPAPDPSTSRFLLGAAYGDLVMFSAFAAALLTATFSVIGLRHHVLPRWLAIAGIPAALLMLANAALPMGVITVWFAVASITLVVRRPPQPASAPDTPQMSGSAPVLA